MTFDLSARPMVLFAKTHVSGYTTRRGTYVAPHEDRRPAKQSDLFRRDETGGDQVIVLPYASGMSRKRDMNAAIESAAGVGTVIGEISRPGMETIANAIADGKEFFVDSGAFPAFKAAMRQGEPEKARLDFEKVFAKYNELSRLVRERAPDNTSLLMMVAPDVVGDQTATLELLDEHKEQIMDWIESGHEVVIPFQRGPLKQSEVYAKVIGMIEGLPFVVGIPSSAEAMSSEELHELLSQPYKPDRIHILGAVSSKRMQDRMAVIRDAYVDDVPGVTADANIMRSKLHELAGLQGQEKFDAIKDIINRVTPKHYGGQLTKSFEFYRLLKAHPISQAVQRGTPAPDLNDGEIRRNPGEPSPEQAKADRYQKPLLTWNGLSIRVENPAGSVRRGQDRAGKVWETRMVYDYGYVVSSEGVDGDEVDVYVGPNPAAPMVYVVHQRKYGDWDVFDEDKCMLGFDSEDDAAAAYLKHYNDPRFLGPITAMTVDEFKAKVRATKEKPAMIKALAREMGDFGGGPRVLFLKAHVKGHTRRLPTGKVVTVDPYDTKVQKRGSGDGQMDMFVAADEHGEVPPAKVVFTRKPGEKRPSKDEAMKEFIADSRKAKTPSAVDGDENARMLADRGGAAEKVASAYFRVHSRGPVTTDQSNDIRRFYSGDKGMEALEKIAAAHGDASIGDLMDRVIERALGKPETGKQKKFYVTMIREPGPRQKVAWLAGPFDRHEDALAHVEPARKKANEMDGWSEFDAFGTTGLTAVKHPPGVLNAHLGIGVKEKQEPRVIFPKKSSEKVDDYSKKINNVGESEKNSIGGAMSYTKEQLDYIEDVLDQHVGLWGPKDHAEFQKMWAERKKTPQPLRDKSLSARNEAKALGGKALKGSRKQKEWAEKIRAEKLKDMAEQQAAMAVDPNGLLAHSKFWIENRDKSGRMIGEFVEKQKGLLARHKETSDSDERKKIADEYNALTAEWGFE